MEWGDQRWWCRKGCRGQITWRLKGHAEVSGLYLKSNRKPWKAFEQGSDVVPLILTDHSSSCMRAECGVRNTSLQKLVTFVQVNRSGLQVLHDLVPVLL